MGLAACRPLTAGNFRTAVLRDLRRVRGAGVVSGSAGAQVGDRNRLADSAAVLSGRTLGGDDVGVTTGLGDVGFGRDERDSPGAIFTERKYLERIKSGFRVASGLGMAAPRRDGNRIALGAEVA